MNVFYITSSQIGDLLTHQSREERIESINHIVDTQPLCHSKNLKKVVKSGRKEN